MQGCCLSTGPAWHLANDGPQLVADGVHEGVLPAAADPVEVVDVDGPDADTEQSVLQRVVRLSTPRDTHKNKTKPLVYWLAGLVRPDGARRS